MYEYSAWQINFYKDISDMVIDYSYDCTSEDNTHQTASITLKVSTDDQGWFMKRENKMREWIDDSNMSFNSISNCRYAYHLTKQYHNQDGNVNEIDLGFFVPVSDEYSYDATTGTITISLSGLSILLTKEHGGGVVTYTNTTTTVDPETHERKSMTLPVTLSISEGVSIDSDLLYEVAMGSNNHDVSFLNQSAPIPIQWAEIGNGQKIHIVPYDLDFDADISRADMLGEIMEIGFEGATYWINENRVLQMSSKPTKRGGVALYWRDYAELFLSENSSYDDSGLYNITEVYGKDNAYYAICDESLLDGNLAFGARKQVLTFSELQSNEECLERAKWENYKARYGHQSFTVTICDKYIPKFNRPSSYLVGKIIEYTTVDGDTNIFFLNKLSYSSNKWTMELKLFKPLYRYDSTNEERHKTQLEIPQIYKHEIIDNQYLRLYVTGEDIQSGIIKIYTGVSDFIGESCLVAENGIDKYIDIPITRNGLFQFEAALYSPYYEDSGLSQIYNVDINIKSKPIMADPDPYPHPNMFEPEDSHEPYLTTPSRKTITTSDGVNITI